MTPNLTPARDRMVSVTRVAGGLTEAALSQELVGREVYRHTRYLAVHGDDGAVLAEVERRDEEPLFSPITGLRLLGAPDQTRWVHDATVDTSVPSQIAAAAATHAPDARVVIVTGRYGHVGFIMDPRPLDLLVVDVVPPVPAKLIDQVRRVLDTAESLPPVLVHEQCVDLTQVGRETPAATYLLPCRGGDTVIDGHPVAYLDERPERQDWVLLGCARSRELHRWFYGDLPPNVDTCPRERVKADRPTLTKCCLLDSGFEQDGAVVTVPWGASLAEVRDALERLVGGE